MTERNNTSWTARYAERLRELHAEFQADPAAGTLKFYQFLTRAVFADPRMKIEGARGLLLYVPMGLGKTRAAVATAMALWDERAVIVMLPRSLEKNFRSNVETVVRLVHPSLEPEALELEIAKAHRRFEFVAMDADGLGGEALRRR